MTDQRLKQRNPLPMTIQCQLIFQDQFLISNNIAPK